MEIKEELGKYKYLNKIIFLILLILKENKNITLNNYEILKADS